MRNFKLLLLTLSVVLLMTCCQRSNPIVIIPEPVSCTAKHGNFTINDETFLCFENIHDDHNLSKIINDSYKTYFHFKPNLGSKNSCRKNYILFEMNEKEDPELGNEGYLLEVTPKHIKATANTAAGLYYAFQTLLQMTFVDKANHNEMLTVPCAQIKDYPRFAYRGAQLDVSRHWFDVDFVKEYIDMMAIYKLNKFNWHFTDDHGWRIEIEQYPELTSIGAWRPERKSWDREHPVLPEEPKTYGGYYTKEQMREIVEYAAERYIDVIPEIEMPGHCSAILAAYPQLACDDYPYTVAVGPYWPPKAIMCAGNDEVLTFYKNVLNEVAEIFPYSMIHIGGDEANHTNWTTCPKCQQRIQDKGLKDEVELQQWLMDKVDAHVKSLGKTSIMWDDVVSKDMVNKSIIMAWQGHDVAVTAAKHGNDVIMCPTTHCYFNFYQKDASDEREWKICQAGLITLEKAYSYDPMPKGLTEEESKHILGPQANLWTEFINTPKHARYMIFPRVCALAECAWTPVENKDWEKFQNKVKVHETLKKNNKNKLNFER